jgi:hypothetical protein
MKRMLVALLLITTFVALRAWCERLISLLDFDVFLLGTAIFLKKVDFSFEFCKQYKLRI